MWKGASIAIICLALGGFIGHRATVNHFESVAKAFFNGQSAAKK